MSRIVFKPEDEGPNCRVCGIPLFTHAEKMIGVHVGCVFDARGRKIRPKLPGYASRKRGSKEKWPSLK